MYPESFGKPADELLEKTLPFGAKINSFIEDVMDKNKLLVYTFKIDNKKVRADFAAIGFVYSKGTNKFVLKDVVGELFKFLNSKKLLSVNVLKRSIPEIVESINKDEVVVIKFKKKNFKFDIPEYLKKRSDELLGPIKGIWE